MPVSVDLREGDCLRVLSEMEDESVDAIVTDPPAGISFMNKSWDGDKGGRDEWIEWMTSVFQECLRVLKPGGHALVWSLPRTSHWTAMALENAGFQVREKIAHLFATGFPKSLDVSKAIDKAAGVEREVVGVRQYADGTSGHWGLSDRYAQDSHTKSLVGGTPKMDTRPATPEAQQWNGWGTALKPSREDWLLVRKPISEKNVATNVLKHGTGAINIDACRIGSDPVGWKGHAVGGASWNEDNCGLSKPGEPRPVEGRWPANTILSHGDCEDGCEPCCPIQLLDRQSGIKKSPDPRIMRRGAKSGTSIGGHGRYGTADPHESMVGYGDEGGASRFFHHVDPDPFVYCAKPSQRERNAGCEGLPEVVGGVGDMRPSGSFNERLHPGSHAPVQRNSHPTIKPLSLMVYLCKLVTPPGGTVLDPFMGSGTTGMAAVMEGFNFIGIEREEEYLSIARARIQSALEQVESPREGSGTPRSDLSDFSREKHERVAA